MSLAEPIVEGAYYERYCGRIAGPMTPALMRVYAALPSTELTRRVYITHTDPAEVVAELRQREKGARFRAGLEEDGEYGGTFADGMRDAADLVAEKLVGGK